MEEQICAPDYYTHIFFNRIACHKKESKKTPIILIIWFKSLNP